MSKDKEYPKEGSSCESTMPAYSVEVSPITHDIEHSHRIGRRVWLRDKWYRLPTSEVHEGLGIPNAKVDGSRQDGSLFTIAGARALMWAFIANQEAERPHFKWGARIITHEIKSTYKDIETGILEENADEH